MKAHYTSCDELPLYNFIKIATTGNLAWLNIDGPYTEVIESPELEEAWSVILEEYNKNSMGNDANDPKYYWMKIFAVEEGQITILKLAHNLLIREEEPYDESTNKIISFVKIRALGLILNRPFTFCGEQKQDDLKVLSGVIKTFEMDLRQDISEYERQNSEEKAPEELESFHSYMKTVAILSKYMKFKIDVHQTKVTEYLTYIALFMEEVAQAEKNNKSKN